MAKKKVATILTEVRNLNKTKESETTKEIEEFSRSRFSTILEKIENLEIAVNRTQTANRSYSQVVASAAEPSTHRHHQQRVPPSFPLTLMMGNQQKKNEEYF